MMIYWYEPEITEAIIIVAIQIHRQRDQQPQTVRLNPTNDLGRKEIDGVAVEVTERQRPSNHFGIVI